MLYSALLPYRSDAADYYHAIADLPWAVWLDSGGRGRYDIFTALPQVTLLTHGKVTVIRDDAGTRSASTDPYQLLREQLDTTIKPEEGIIFAGGVLGYWAYDLMRQNTASCQQDMNVAGQPDMAIGIYDWAIQLDHQAGTARLISHQRYAKTSQIIQQILQRLKQKNIVPKDNFQVHGIIRSNFNRASYELAFKAVREYLEAGDCYQVNLAQRFTARASGDAFLAYKKLRQLNPAPYSAFLNFNQIQVLCVSPERFLQVQQGKVETRPVKGTRPSVADVSQNKLMAEDLRNSPKDRAENLMIVDLLRNDLSKNCVPGSVQVPALFEVESFATVHHLVSTVTGELAPGKDALSLLHDCFPGGSITGAPKRRAMEIIEQLEPHRRGLYCGSIGYIGFDGNMDSNIVIRTLIYSDGVAHGWAGGGIVADSECAAEYQETLDKAGAMLELLRSYGGLSESE